MGKLILIRPLALCLVGLALALQACTATPDAAPAEAEQQLGEQEHREAEPSQPVEESGESASPETSLSVPNICETLTGDEVVTIAGGALLREPNAADYGEDFQGCTYELDPGDGGYDYYIVYVQPSAWLLTVFADEAELLPGLGDQAQLKWEEGEQQYRLVVVEGGLGIEVIGENSDVIVQFAQVLLERLGP